MNTFPQSKLGISRETLVSALWWLGVVWVLVGILAFLYSFTLNSPTELFMTDVGFAVWVLLAPGVVAMHLSLFLSSRAK